MLTRSSLIEQEHVSNGPKMWVARAVSEQSRFEADLAEGERRLVCLRGEASRRPPVPTMPGRGDEVLRLEAKCSERTEAEEARYHTSSDPWTSVQKWWHLRFQVEDLKKERDALKAGTVPVIGSGPDITMERDRNRHQAGCKP